MSNSALPRFSSESFRVSSFTFQSLIHFEFIFMYDVRAYSKFIILHVTVQFSRHHLLNRLSFWFTSILFRIFASVVFSDIGLSFTFLFLCVCVCVCVCLSISFCSQCDGGLKEWAWECSFLCNFWAPQWKKLVSQLQSSVWADEWPGRAKTDDPIVINSIQSPKPQR